jgi:hypothetical protein
MIRLLTVIVIFIIFICLIIFNLPNKCDVSFGFTTIKDVPVFLSALSSFVLGMFVTVPMMLFRKKKQPPSVFGPPDSETAKPGPFKKAKLKSTPGEIKKEDSAYGID